MSLRSIVPARKMSTRHIRVASERRNGAAIQQTRPSWTMIVDVDQVVVVSVANVSGRGQVNVGEDCFVDTRQGEYISSFRVKLGLCRIGQRRVEEALENETAKANSSAVAGAAAGCKPNF